MPEVKLAGLDKDGNEKEISLSDFKGRRIVLYFYPKDNTSGCTQEACDCPIGYIQDENRVPIAKCNVPRLLQRVIFQCI